MDYIMTQFLLVAQIFCLLLIFWQVKDLTPKKRKYRHTQKFLTKNK